MIDKPIETDELLQKERDRELRLMCLKLATMGAAIPTKEHIELAKAYYTWIIGSDEHPVQ